MNMFCVIRNEQPTHDVMFFVTVSLRDMLDSILLEFIQRLLDYAACFLKLFLFLFFVGTCKSYF